MKLLVIRGLPASGKSTLAKKLTEEDKTYIRVNKDDIRRMLNTEGGAKENFVIEIRDSIIVHALKSGLNVVSDDTNLHPKHLERFTDLAKEYGAEVVIKDMDISVEECIRRDHGREYSVGPMVIRGMYNKYLKEEYDG